jgi:membrane protease YdiL (CAAX protease family)
MPQLLYLGLLIALIGAPLLAALSKLLRLNPLSLVPRLAFWAAAVAVLVIAAANIEAWHTHLGLEQPTWQSLVLALLAAALMLSTLGAHQSAQRKRRKDSPEQLRQLQNILALPFSHRCFIVVTAAVTEEVLYRGYAIGVGQHLLGSVWLACVVSVATFTFAHLRWGLAHLLPVFVSALVLSLLFAFTQNLWACIIAHAIVDAVGFLVVPAVMARQNPDSAQTAG